MSLNSIPDPLNVNAINTKQITTDTIAAGSVTGTSGGTVITASKIILGGWLIQAKDDGIYITTPSGIETKVELIDFRETPVPPTAGLKLPTGPAQNPSKDVQGGPQLPGQTVF